MVSSRDWDPQELKYDYLSLKIENRQGWRRVGVSFIGMSERDATR